MQALIKRLQIIQAAIALGDEALLAAQIQTWQAAWADSPINRGHAEPTPDAGDESGNSVNNGNNVNIAANGSDDHSRESLAAIDAAFTALDYALADSLISQLIAQRSALAVYQDSEVAALKLELSALERQFAERSHQHAETVHRIEGFNRDYTIRLGATLAEILKLQMMVAHHHAEQYRQQQGEDHDDNDHNDLDDDAQYRAYRQAYEQAQQAYQQFHGDYEQQLSEPARQTLSEEEQQRLKTAYRRASRLCHPDMVAEEFAEQATRQFQALNDAYKQNDLATVEKILHSLQSGGGFVAASEQVDDQDRLRALVRDLRDQIAALEVDTQRLQSDQVYQLICSLEGEVEYQAYFDDLQAQLQAERDQLRSTLQAI